MVLGYPEQALKSARRAVQLDPLSPESVVNLSLSLTDNGYAEEGGRASEVQPDWTTGPLYEALALYELGRHGAAAALLHGLVADWVGSGPRLTLALCRIGTGHTERGRETLAAFEAEDDPFAVGVLNLALGERERGGGSPASKLCAHRDPGKLTISDHR